MRKKPTDYAGAVGRIDLATAARLGDRYAVQPKLDGAYCRVALDDEGRIATLTSRSGREFGERQIGDLPGCRIGTPNAQLVGEIEGHTEVGRRVADRRGYQVIHLFDALSIDGQDLSLAPYRQRRDALWRMQSALADRDPDRYWYSDREGNAHHSTTGDYVRRVPRGWRRAPIVPQVAAAQADQLWADHVAAGDAEGLVVVALDAPIGRRNAKRKIKLVEYIDAACVRADDRVAILHWQDADLTFAVGRRHDLEMPTGMTYEIAHEGFYDSGAPRFPRLVREREDIVSLCAWRAARQ